MVTRYLVTTADERTWPKNQPLLFIGEWCKRYSRKKIWQSCDSLTLNYHWDDRKQLKDDYIYLQNVYEVLLVKSAEILNEIHDKNFSVRYWRILIGPWLGYFIHILFDRWSMLKLAVTENDIKAVNILQQDFELYIPQNMENFVEMFVTDEWNEFIYGQLLSRYFNNHININFIKTSSNRFNKSLKNSWQIKFKNFISNLMSIFNRLFVRSKDYFFIATYLPVFFELKVQFKLGQIPKIWRPVQVTNVEMKMDLRLWRLSHDQSDDFIDVACEMIALNIPRIYLEGFQTLHQVCENLYWPKNPTCIFTSNSYSEDDVFKCWTAEKTEHGTPLVIGQHGGHMGMALWAFYEEHQIKIADHWISWGWENQEDQTIRAFGNLKTINRRLNYNPKGYALIVELLIPRYSYHLYAGPVASQLVKYFDEQYTFIKALPKNIQSEMLVRLNKADYGWDQSQRWTDINPEVSIESGASSIDSLICKSRICISTYNATTFLESLHLNVPTLMFWNESYWELREDAKSDFELLKSVGIFHITPESAAAHLENIWENIDDWWLSDKVQKIRRNFCNRFSRNINDPVIDMKNLFINIDKSVVNL